MSSKTSRLSFLYPHLFRTARLSETTASHAPNASISSSLSSSLPSSRCRHSGRGAGGGGGGGLGDTAGFGFRSRGYAAFAPTPGARQSGFAPRHGKAVEPVKIGGEGAGKTGSQAPAPAPAPISTSGNKGAAAAPAATGRTVARSLKGAGVSSGDGNKKSNARNSSQQTPTTKTTTTTTTTTTTPPSDDQSQQPMQQQPQQQQASKSPQGATEGAKQEARDQAKKSGPLEAILHMGPPEQVAKQHPHMAPTPYVHHFDSYSLVKQLEGGGYTEDQAITAMKAIRTILAQNLDVAQASLVSKSDVENETYLFRAACSELSTEVKNNQKLADEEMRQKRTLLQHEVDILAQSLNQEILTLNDNVRGMFNDRKMAVREEQKAGESVIQQINYKISLLLSSDAKSEIESLRWVLIRRSVIGILFMAVLTLGTLRYGTYVSHEKQKEAERIRKQAELIKQADGKKDHSSAPDAAEILAAN